MVKKVQVQQEIGARIIKRVDANNQSVAESYHQQFGLPVVAQDRCLSSYSGYLSLTSCSTRWY